MLTKEGLINFLRDIKCEHSIQNSYGATLYKYYAPIINEDLLEPLADFLIESDFEKVTRCKDCKYYTRKNNRCDHPHLNFAVECFDHWLEVTDDDYCNYGIRKESNNEQ